MWIGLGLALTSSVPTIRPIAAETLLASLTAVGVTSGLQMCLDAGSSASYDGSAQQWTDVSGQANHVYRGTTSGSDATDPTFNGVAGALSSAEFFSFDAGDYFTLVAAANPAFIETFHKALGKGTLLFVLRPGAIGTIQGLCGTGISTGSGTGFSSHISAGGNLQLVVVNAGATVLSQVSTLTFAAGTTYMIAIAWDASVGAGGIAYARNYDADTDTSTYSSPASGSATNKLHIGNRAGGNSPLSSGSRLYAAAIYDSALTAAQLGNIARRLRQSSRFGI